MHPYGMKMKDPTYLYDMAETCFGEDKWEHRTLQINELLIKVLDHYNVKIGNTIFGYDENWGREYYITQLEWNDISLCVIHDNTNEGFASGYFQSYHDYDKTLTEIGGILYYTATHLYMFYGEGFDFESHVLKGETK